jgi:hypothetical protein
MYGLFDRPGQQNERSKVTRWDNTRDRISAERMGELVFC